MMKLVKNFINGKAVFIFIVTFSLSNIPFLVGTPKSLSFQGKIDEAQYALEDVYYDLVEKGHFDDSSDLRLIFHGNMLSNFPENGEILLKLVEQLQKRSHDIDSQHLLDLINTVLCLRLHRFICKLETSKEKQGSITQSFFILHGHKSITPSGTGNYFPFQASLTKMMLAILTVVYSDFRHDAQKEMLIYRFEEIKQELIATNKELREQAIDEKHIFEFIKFMGSYGLVDPLVKPRNIKQIILVSAIIIGLIAVIVYVSRQNWKTFFDTIKQRVEEVSASAGRATANAMFEAGEARYATPAQRAAYQAAFDQSVQNAVAIALAQVRQDTEAMRAEVPAASNGLGREAGLGLAQGLATAPVVLPYRAAQAARDWWRGNLGQDAPPAP